MLGTLVVCLPIPHRGGALSVSSCDANPTVFDWSTDPAHPLRALRWAAMFGDADHSVAAVEEGHRVTVTYALRLTGEARAPADDRAVPFRDALSAALRDREFMPDGGVLLVPCAHHVIAPTNADAAYATRDLRGLDRDLAEAAVALGIIVGLRPCLAITEMRDQRKPPAEPFVHALDVARLKRALSDQTIGALGEYVTFARKGRDDDGEDVDAFSLASALFRGEATDAFTVRPRACATLIHETCFSFDGCFGNEHFDAWMYAAVAIELSIPTQKERGVAPPEPAGRRVRHATFGAGTVTDEGPPGDDGVLTIRFDADGVVKRLQRKFVVDVC